MTRPMIEETVSRIKPLDTRVLEDTQARLDKLTKPLGSLGLLEALAKQVVAATGKTHPSFKSKVVFCFAADHGVAAEGVSAYPSEVTAQMVMNFLEGGAAINVLARHAGARVVVADLGVASAIPTREGLVSARIGPGTASISRGPAMTPEQARAAIEAGIGIAEREIAAGADLIATGDMGIGNTTAASAIVAAMTGMNPLEVTGYGTGIDEERRVHKAGVIAHALTLNRPDPGDALDVLAKVGGFEIGGLAGVMLAGAANRVPVIIDGFISGAAALIACGLAPALREHLIAAHRSAERGHAAALNHIGLAPLVSLGMRLGEGTGAVLAMHLVEASVKILSEMATFESAGVSGRAESEPKASPAA